MHSHPGVGLLRALQAVVHGATSGADDKMACWRMQAWKTRYLAQLRQVCEHGHHSASMQTQMLSSCKSVWLTKAKSYQECT